MKSHAHTQGLISILKLQHGIRHIMRMGWARVFENGRLFIFIAYTMYFSEDIEGNRLHEIWYLSLAVN
jgi:hypothetical protein